MGVPPFKETPNWVIQPPTSRFQACRWHEAQRTGGLRERRKSWEQRNIVFFWFFFLSDSWSYLGSTWVKPDDHIATWSLWNIFQNTNSKLQLDLRTASKLFTHLLWILMASLQFRGVFEQSLDSFLRRVLATAIFSCFSVVFPRRNNAERIRHLFQSVSQFSTQIRLCVKKGLISYHEDITWTMQSCTRTISYTVNSQWKRIWVFRPGRETDPGWFWLMLFICPHCFQNTARNCCFSNLQNCWLTLCWCKHVLMRILHCNYCDISLNWLALRATSVRFSSAGIVMEIIQGDYSYK